MSAAPKAVLQFPRAIVRRLPVPQADPDTKLSAANLNFHYGAFQALHDVDLRIYKNRITALIGPSGCGKSTFLRVLNRMYETLPGSRLEGIATIDGIDLQEIDPIDLRRRVGMVFQRPNPFPKSIFENVAYGVRIAGERNKQDLGVIVQESLIQAALWDEVKDRLHKSALDLSGGQQQRLCIARALAVKPEVLLLDEPCSALDPPSTGKIEELLLGLREKYTLVIVTHNMQQAARVSDYTGFFLMGRLIEFGRTPQMFEFPARRETEDYVSGRVG